MTAAEIGAQLRIPEAMLAAAGVRDVSDVEARDLLGQHGFRGSDLGGVVFPVRNPRTGEHLGDICRVDNPPTDGPRYLQPQGCRWLYTPPVPAEWLDDLGVPAAFVEGPKSALALLEVAKRAGCKLLPIAMGGCGSWRRRDGFRDLPDGGHEPVTAPSPTFDAIEWAGRDVVLALDGDKRTNPKVSAALRALAVELDGRGASVRIARIPPEAGPKAAPDDVIEKCGDAAALAMLDAALPWQAAAKAAAEGFCAELLALAGAARKTADPMPFIRAAAALADMSQRDLLIGRVASERLPGVTREFLRHQIAAERGEVEATQVAAAESARQGRLLAMDLDPAELLGDMVRFFTERAYLPKGAAMTLGLWSLFTWCVDSFVTAPYICLESLIPGCGKSTVLDLLEAICARAEQSAMLTKALLARTIEKTKATMLFDQAESLRDKKDESGLVTILLSGYRRGKPYRCLVGDEHEPAEFSVFGPKAFCAVGGLAGALLDRCLVLHMEKKPAEVELESAEPEDLAPVAGPLRERLEAFALKAAPALEAIKASRPKGGHWTQFNNRERQLWTPLLSIARVCGPEAERRAVAAAELLAGSKAQAQADDPRAAKVAALAEVLAGLTAEKFSPKDLVPALVETEAWGEALVEKLRKDDTGKSAANLIGHFLRDFKLQMRERQSKGSLYNTAETLEKARQHMPATPGTSATSATYATDPMNTRGFGVADASESRTASATKAPRSATEARTGQPAATPAVADATPAVADAVRDSATSATLKSRANCGVVADVAVVADKAGVRAPSQTGTTQGGLFGGAL